ncbi:MAG: hypothetical protein KGH76_03380 [Thaumarchaeota archaeon]|nr:hypothetical protein [Nitrososphaerota archaeon]
MLVLVHETDFLPFYNQLKSNSKKNKPLLDAINNVKLQLSKSDRPLGIHHKRENIPNRYKTRYNLQALYHFEMPDNHRLMYTIRKSTVAGKEVLFLELLTHDEYNKLFGYFKKKSH